MGRFRLILASLPVGVIALPALGGGLGPYADETNPRMIFPNVIPTLTYLDGDEKDYAWGDVDNDGDTDLVIVRKQVFTSVGKRVNVLLINVDGIFHDMTEEFVTASDVPGDEGFDTPTNDRDVVLVDLDNDGWLDMVTATTMSVGEPKHISHPRVYMNLGEDGGEWQGFVHEDGRIPELHPTEGPRFCSVAAGDLTGDGYADLYFGDYDSGGFSGPPMLFDYNNRLLVNQGGVNPALAGFFVDESTLRMTGEMLLSAFGAASVIADMNDDGVDDVVKQTSLFPPQHIAVVYNNPALEGFFNNYDIVNDAEPYFVSVGDLNNDGRLDMVEVDDFTDRIMLNIGNGGDGLANFSTFTLPSATNGFGGNSIIHDLDQDGWQDIIITDVDVDIAGCGRSTDILRNNGNPPNVTFSIDNGGIEPSDLFGSHDVAVFDINGDGWDDLIFGRCGTTEVWINQNEPIITPCDGDLDDTGTVGFNDLLILLAAWGQSGVPADLDGGGVGFSDLLVLLAAWGECP